MGLSSRPGRIQLSHAERECSARTRPTRTASGFFREKKTIGVSVSARVRGDLRAAFFCRTALGQKQLLAEHAAFGCWTPIGTRRAAFFFSLQRHLGQAGLD